jgi:hypothetical protein
VIYRDTVPSFTPTPIKILAITTATEHEDVNAAGNTSINYYYYINARAGTLESANSDCVGEFDRSTVNKKKGSQDTRKFEVKRR